MHRRNKIALIGAGNIGGELADPRARARSSATSCCSTSPTKEGFAKGKALDLEQTRALAATTRTSPAPRTGTTAPAPTCVIITAGVPRKPGMTRDDLLVDQPARSSATSPRT